MTTYAYKNYKKPADIVDKAKELFVLEELREPDGIWLGNDRILIDVEENVTRIILYDLSVNIKKLRQFIMGKN